MNDLIGHILSYTNYIMNIDIRLTNIKVPSLFYLIVKYYTIKTGIFPNPLLSTNQKLKFVSNLGFRVLLKMKSLVSSIRNDE